MIIPGVVIFVVIILVILVIVVVLESAPILMNEIFVVLSQVVKDIPAEQQNFLGKLLSLTPLREPEKFKTNIL